MTTRTINRTVQPPGMTQSIDYYGGTLTNNSAFPITVQDQTVAAGGSLALQSGVKQVEINTTQTASVTIVYNVLTEEEAAAQVAIAGSVQIGTEAPSLSDYRLLCSVQTTFGVTYYGEDGLRVGDSASLVVNAGGGASVALPSVPTGAVTAVLTHTGSSSVTLYYDTPGSTATVSDFTTNYTRYPQKLALSRGTRLGR